MIAKENMDSKREETIKTDQQLIKTKWNYYEKSNSFRQISNNMKKQKLVIQAFDTTLI